MENDNKVSRVEPVQLGLNSRFIFECHQKVSCFTKCCRGIDIILTPYDILKLKNRLGLSSDEFLAIYTDLKFLEKTDLPIVTLKLLDDEQHSCPFVRDEEGCIIYNDRPTTCRYYPLGIASLSYTKEREGDEFFFVVRESHCKGFDEEKEWTVKNWRKDQGVDIHDEINAGWTELVVMKKSFPANITINEKAKQMFFMASYNIDKFKRFVFESSFMDRYEIEDSLVEMIKNDDIELLKFGFKWIKSVLFQSEETGEIKGFKLKKNK
ncbi:MAG: YkgJ family cysteine cluster protein [Proteobacteria bacterium]|nr:YkgJ family cysteine cluster protein [Pseudomonadota bacterium]